MKMSCPKCEEGNLIHQEEEWEGEEGRRGILYPELIYCDRYPDCLATYSPDELDLFITG